MPSTMTPIATTTLSSAASSITFSSIPATYTHLRMVFTGNASGNSQSVWLTYNADNGGNYSITRLLGNGTSATSESNSGGATYIDIMPTGGMSSTIPAMIDINVFNYTGSTFKTALIASSVDKSGSGTVQRSVGLWRSTNAITEVKIAMQSGNFASGATATLFGIKAAS